MTERPILFSGPMVRAILAGRKTQTRRIAKGSAPWDDCPYGRPGDQLWVRETLRQHGKFGFPLGECPQVKPIQGRIWSYAADNVPGHTGTRVSIHMPRWACRLVLEVTAVRVERLQEISDDDAIAEGLRPVGDPDRTYKSWPELWDSINAKRAPWASNPWVWVVEFQPQPQPSRK